MFILDSLNFILDAFSIMITKLYDGVQLSLYSIRALLQYNVLKSIFKLYLELLFQVHHRAIHLIKAGQINLHKCIDCCNGSKAFVASVKAIC